MDGSDVLSIWTGAVSMFVPTPCVDFGRFGDGDEVFASGGQLGYCGEEGWRMLAVVGTAPGCYLSGAVEEGDCEPACGYGFYI